MSYADLADFMRALELEHHQDIEGLQQVLDAAAEWIDNYCGRTFAVDEDDVTRDYYPSSTTELRVADLQTVTSLSLDTNGDLTFTEVIAPTDYELLPLDGPPYDLVRLTSASGQAFDCSRRARIVGTFGYDPSSGELALLQQANMLLATRWFKRHEAPFGILGSTEMGQFERLSAEDPDVIAMLQPLMSTGSGAGAGNSWVMV